LFYVADNGRCLAVPGPFRYHRRVQRPRGQAVITAGLVAAIAAVAGSLLLGSHGVRHLRELRAEHRRLAAATVRLLSENARLHDEIEHDDAYLERLARRELGLVRPNETVYRFRRR
jgi:cell division protein FtsB